MRKYLQFFTVVGAFFLLVAIRNALGHDRQQRVIGANLGATGDTTVSQGVLPQASDTTVPTFEPATPALTPTPTRPTRTPASTSTPYATLPPTATPTPKPSSRYKDGTYTGAVADAYYGYVQVQVTVSGGNITNVAFLQHPNDNGTSQYINSQAMPLLTQEVIRAQSAQVDGVSGASATSGAFQQSLASALQKAQS